MTLPVFKRCLPIYVKDLYPTMSAVVVCNGNTIKSQSHLLKAIPTRRRQQQKLKQTKAENCSLYS